MKKYMYAVLEVNTNKLIALYDDLVPAKQLLPELEKKLELDLFVIKQQINKDINRIIAEIKND